jgi:hypothetical protein
MSLYEHAEEAMPPKPAYDPAMDYPEPAPKRRKFPFEIANIGNGGKAYRMEKRTIITQHTAYTRYAFVMMLGEYAKEPYLTIDRRDVAKLLKHYRKEAASC